MTRQNVLRASIAVETDMVEVELLSLKFPSMYAQNARIRQEHARKSVAIMRRARATLEPSELPVLRAMSWRPTLTFVSNRRVKVDTSAASFTRDYTPSLQATRAMRALLKGETK